MKGLQAGHGAGTLPGRTRPEAIRLNAPVDVTKGLSFLLCKMKIQCRVNEMLEVNT